MEPTEVDKAHQLRRRECGRLREQNAALAALAAALQRMVATYGDFKPGVPYELPDDHPVTQARAALSKLRA